MKLAAAKLRKKYINSTFVKPTIEITTMTEDNTEIITIDLGKYKITFAYKTPNFINSNFKIEELQCAEHKK